MATLERAIQIATQAHAGQLDKSGFPYILHPLRVMNAFGPALFTYERKDLVDYRIVAVLHDTIEDTPISLKDLEEEGFNQEILIALDGVTRRGGEKYFDFILRAGSTSKVSHVVKIADILDNMSRLQYLPKKAEQIGLAGRYKKALMSLGCLVPMEIEDLLLKEKELAGYVQTGLLMAYTAH